MNHHLPSWDFAPWGHRNLCYLIGKNILCFCDQFLNAKNLSSLYETTYEWSQNTVINHLKPYIDSASSETEWDFNNDSNSLRNLLFKIRSNNKLWLLICLSIHEFLFFSLHSLFEYFIGFRSFIIYCSLFHLFDCLHICYLIVCLHSWF